MNTCDQGSLSLSERDAKKLLHSCLQQQSLVSTPGASRARDQLDAFGDWSLQLRLNLVESIVVYSSRNS